MELYKRIRNRREELGMSQQELAKKMGYKSRSSINKIELGENDIPQSKIVAFAKALNTTPAELMGFEDSASFEELDIFEEMMALIGWRYETLSECDGLAINEYLSDDDKIHCGASTSVDKCYACEFYQPYYYLTNEERYYKLSKEEFDNLSSCLKPYLEFRINELTSKKNGLTEHEYKIAESLVAEPEKESKEYLLNAAHADDYMGAPEELKQLEEDIIDDENF